MVTNLTVLSVVDGMLDSLLRTLKRANLLMDEIGISECVKKKHIRKPKSGICVNIERIKYNV